MSEIWKSYSVRHFLAFMFMMDLVTRYVHLLLPFHGKLLKRQAAKDSKRNR